MAVRSFQHILCIDYWGSRQMNKICRVKDISVMGDEGGGGGGVGISGISYAYKQNYANLYLKRRSSIGSTIKSAKRKL